MAQTTQRRRVTAQDFPKREIKLDIVEQKIAPPMPVWYLALIIFPVALWILNPAHGALWLALTATAAWLALFGMLAAERKRKDFDTGREIALSLLNGGILGISLGCWAFLIVNTFAS